MWFSFEIKVALAAILHLMVWINFVSVNTCLTFLTKKGSCPFVYSHYILMSATPRRMDHCSMVPLSFVM